MKAPNPDHIMIPEPSCRTARLALALALAWTVGCAKVGVPRGGPVDRQAPEVVDCDPAPDTTGVLLSRAIAISFSEAMERGRTEEAVYLSPHAELDFSWSGRELRIRPGGGLLPDRTYVITVGTDARDLRGNRLERSYTSAFSTGAQLNRGKLSGAVSNARGPASGARVWAYDVTFPDGEVGELGVAAPSYQTQTGSDGTFEFLRLSRGTYRVVAFDDDNDNGRYDRGEGLALPARDAVLVEGGEIHLGDLVLSAPTAGPVQLKRAQAVDEHRVLLVFDREVRAPEVTARIAGLAVERTYSAPDDVRKLYLITAPHEAGRAYRLEVTVAGQTVDWKEPVRGSRRADRTVPALVSHHPRALAAAWDSIALVFSEPLASLPGEGFWVRDDSTEAPAGQWAWEDGVRAVFAPDSSWAPGPHRLVGRLHQLLDLAGLAPADSFAAVTFEVVDGADMAALGGRVSGGTGHPIWVEAVSLESSIAGPAAAARQLSGADGTFLIEGLLPGPIQLSAFEDRNGNGVRDAGRRQPYEPAEVTARLAPDPAPGRGDRIVDLTLELR